MAHFGGHGAAPDSLRLWHFTKTTQPLRASLLVVQSGRVMLEDSLGRRMAFSPADFSKEDQSYIKKRSEEIDRINAALYRPATQSTSESATTHLSQSTIIFGLFSLLFLILAFLDLFRKKYFTATIGAALFSLTFFVACGKSSSSTSSTSCAAAGSATVASMVKPFLGSGAVTTDSTYAYVSSNGIPNHAMMVGILSGGWQQQVPLPQPYNGANAWSIPLNPKAASNPISAATQLRTGAIALAANGIPIFNALDNIGRDANKIGELDNYGGHAGHADDYHYHVGPTTLQSTAGQTNPIAVALDGYFIYGTVEPDGGTLKTLDSFNGHSDCAGGYHYHATSTYPYINGGMHGEVSTSGTSPSNMITPQSSSISARDGNLGPIAALITAQTTTAVSQTSFSTNDFTTSGSGQITYTYNSSTYTVGYSWSGTNQWGSGKYLNITWTYSPSDPDTNDPQTNGTIARQNYH